MKVILSPIVKNEKINPPKILLDGLKLIIDGKEIDLSIIPDGGKAEADENSPFLGTITREEINIKYFYSTHNFETKQPTEVKAYTFEIESGEVPCPLIKRGE